MTFEFLCAFGDFAETASPKQGWSSVSILGFILFSKRSLSLLDFFFKVSSELCSTFTSGTSFSCLWCLLARFVNLERLSDLGYFVEFELEDEEAGRKNEFVWRRGRGRICAAFGQRGVVRFVRIFDHFVDKILHGSNYGLDIDFHRIGRYFDHDGDFVGGFGNCGHGFAHNSDHDFVHGFADGFDHHSVHSQNHHRNAPQCHELKYSFDGSEGVVDPLQHGL